MTTITQTITALPTAPARTDDPATFITRADAMMAALPTMVTQENTWAGQANTVAGEVNSNAATATTQVALATAQVALATTQVGLATTQATNAAASAVTAVNAPGTNATSTTSLAVGTGSKSLTIQTSKSLVVGMSVKIAYTVTPTTWMFGDITAHDSTTGALTINVTQVNGSGTQSTWTVSLSGPSLSTGGNLTGALNLARATVASAATTADIWAAAGNQIDWTGTTTCTAFPAAPQAGSERVLICAGAAVFTAGANMLIDGVASGNLTCVANDQVIVRAVTTTQFKLSRVKYDGTAQVVAAASSPVQYPQLIKSADYTLVLGDAGYQIFHPASDTAARTFTIPANASVAYAIGTVLVFVNPNGAQQVTVAITTDTLIDMRGVTGPRTFAMNNILTVLKITATRWMCYFSDNDNPAVAQFLAIAHFVSPFVTAYPWSSSGFGTKFTNPSTLPTGVGNGAAFSPAGTELAIAHSSLPYVTAYPWSSSGFGTKFTNPATLPADNGNGAAFSPSGTELAIAHGATPHVTAYPWSSSGFGAKFTNPATVPPSTGWSAAFSPAGTELAIGHNTTPYVSVYPWSSAGFGTKFTNPATVPTGEGAGVAFSPAGTELAIAHGTTPFVTAYPWSSSGFGTRFANPATLPTATAKGAAFSPSGTELAIAHNISPYVTAYPWSSSGFGVKFADPATLPTGQGNGAAFSPAGTELAIAYDATPWVNVYPWSSSGFGAKFANPATVPTGTGMSPAFSQS